MASKIKIMISSRCNDEFNGESLSKIRKIMQKCLERVKIFGKPIFKVWIIEEADAQGKNSRDLCLKEARESDIFLCLYNGNPGTDGIICLEELEKAFNQSPEKVIPFFLEHDESKADKDFQEYLKKIDRTYKKVDNFTDLKKAIENSVRKKALELMRDGVKEASKSAKDRGPALDWARLTFEERSRSMIKRVSDGLGNEIIGGSVIKELKGKQVLFVPKAIPSSFSVSAAREMVGQPFLNDHDFSKKLEKEKAIGPVHIIACSKNITEAQATNLLGFPDALIVSSSFGVYVADRIQRIQICFITQCTDSASTKLRVEEFIKWLTKDSDEAGDFIKRAESRAKIVKSIADENDKPKSTQA